MVSQQDSLNQLNDRSTRRHPFRKWIDISEYPVSAMISCGEIDALIQAAARDRVYWRRDLPLWCAGVGGFEVVVHHVFLI